MLVTVEDGYSASQAAKVSGFSLDTLRYYERIGLLDGIERTPSGHRRFRDEDLEWLGVLRCLRDTGMPIAQMRKYAELSCVGQATLAERMSLLIEHDTQVKERIALLQAQHDYLQDKIAWYRSQMTTAASGEGMNPAPVRTHPGLPPPVPGLRSSAAGTSSGAVRDDRLDRMPPSSPHRPRTTRRM